MFTLRTLERKLQKLLQKVSQEKARNDSIMQESIGLPVVYGAEVQIMHHDSKSFICGSSECSQNIKVGYKCSLSRWYSKKMGFRIRAQLKSRNDGESIQYRDLLVFENTENQSYLSFCYSQVVRMFDYEEVPSSNPFRPKIGCGVPNTDTYECFLSLLASTSFSCVFHSSGRRDPRFLRGQIMFRVVHCESDGRLGIDIAHIEKQPEAFIRRVKIDRHRDNRHKKEIDIEENPGSTIWEAEHPNVIDSGKPFRLNRRYDSDDESRHSSPIILKHLASDLRLEVSSRARDSMSHLDLDRGVPMLENPNILEYPRSESNVNTVFSQNIYFYPLVKSQESIMFDHSYFISSGKNRFLKLTAISETYSRDHKIKNFGSTEEPAKRDYFSPKSESTFGYSKQKCFFSEGIDTRDTFLLKPVPEDECRIALFYKSTIPLLTTVSSFFRENLTINDNLRSARKAILDRLYPNVAVLLRKVILFVVDKDNISEEQLETQEIEPVKKRQQLLRDFGLIDLFMEIIYFPFKNAFYRLDDLKPSCPFTPVIKSCYLALRKGIEEFRTNELYASQWLEVIIDHSINTGTENNIHADRTMRELIDNNRAILESITMKTVEMYIGKLKMNPLQDDKYIVILRALCICDGRAVIHNQRMLANLLLLNEVTRDTLLVQIKSIEEGPIYVYIKEDESWESLEVFARLPHRQRFYSYLLSMVNLLSDICFDRNYLGIEALQAQYPITTCLSILTKNSLPNELRQAFGRLMTNLWINVTPYYKLVLPNPVKTYEGLCDGVHFTHYYGKRIIYDKVKAYIPRYIDGFTKRGTRSHIQEVALLNIMLEIIE